MRFVAALVLILLPGCCDFRRIELAMEQERIRSIAAIHRAETEFYAQYGRFGELSELPDVPLQSVSYLRLVVTRETYTITAPPADARLRSFYSDQTLVIRQSTTREPANVNSPEIR